MFIVPFLLLDDALQPLTTFIDGEVNESLRKFVLLSDNHLLELLDWVVAGDTPSAEGTQNSVPYSGGSSMSGLFEATGSEVQQNVTHSRRSYARV